MESGNESYMINDVEFTARTYDSAGYDISGTFDDGEAVIKARTGKNTSTVTGFYFILSDQLRQIMSKKYNVEFRPKSSLFSKHGLMVYNQYRLVKTEDGKECLYFEITNESDKDYVCKSGGPLAQLIFTSKVHRRLMTVDRMALKETTIEPGRKKLIKTGTTKIDYGLFGHLIGDYDEHGFCVSFPGIIDADYELDVGIVKVNRGWCEDVYEKNSVAASMEIRNFYRPDGFGVVLKEDRVGGFGSTSRAL